MKPLKDCVADNIPRVIPENIYRHGDHIHLAPRLTVTAEQFGYRTTLVLWKGDVRIAEADGVLLQTSLTEDDREWLAEWAFDALNRLDRATSRATSTGSSVHSAVDVRAELSEDK